MTRTLPHSSRTGLCVHRYTRDADILLAPGALNAQPLNGMTIDESLRGLASCKPCILRIFPYRRLNAVHHFLPKVGVFMPLFPTTWNDAVRQIFANPYGLLVRKQSDYGRGNIAVFVELGVLVRLSDHLERLKHLQFTHDTEGHVIPRTDLPHNESIDDSYRDLLNYALIATMIRHRDGNRPFDASDSALSPELAPLA